MVPFGNHTLATYTKAHATDATGSFVICQDFEDFTGKSGDLIAGMNTVATDTYFNATFSPATSFSALLNFFVHYDVLLAFKNGMIHVVP